MLKPDTHPTPPRTPIQAFKVWRRIIDDLAEIDKLDGRQIPIFFAFSEATDIILTEASKLHVDPVGISQASEVLKRHAPKAATRWSKIKANRDTGGCRRMATSDMLPKLVKLPASDAKVFTEGLKALQALERISNHERAVRDREEQRQEGKGSRKPNDSNRTTQTTVSHWAYTILQALSKSRPKRLTQYDLEANEELPSRNTIRRCLKELTTNELVDHPTPRSGYGITEKGRKVIEDQ